MITPSTRVLTLTRSLSAMTITIVCLIKVQVHCKDVETLVDIGTILALSALDFVLVNLIGDN